MSSEDPTRWRDEPDLDADLRALLDAGAAELPHPEQLDRLESRLFPPIVPGGGGGAPPAASLFPKAALAIAAAAALGAVTWIALDNPSPVAPTAQATDPVSVPAPAPDPVPVPALAPVPTRPTQDPVAELALLEAAQSALATSPARALAIAQQHARRFPDGALAQEREVIVIDALVRLDRAPDAEARARRFDARWPSSAHRRRIDVILHHP